MSNILTIEHLQDKVDQVNMDLDFLKQETSENIINKKTKELEQKVITVKDDITKKINQLKQLGESSHTSEIAKLETMLVVLETSTSQLTDLKSHIYMSGHPSLIPNATSEVSPTSSPNTKSRFGRNRGWVVGGSLAGLLTFSWLRKKKKQDDERSSFGSKVWKGIKYAGLAVGGYFGLKWLIGTNKHNDALDWLGIRKRPDAPNVSADDMMNTITGLAVGMEYSIDKGKTYVSYDPANVPTFPGDQKVLVRTKKTSDAHESKTKELVFTRTVDGGTNASTSAPEQDNLTPEELTKRNAAITKSIKEAKSFPVTIDYGSDKQLLESKGCPTTIDFDVAKQSIMLGTHQLAISVGNFQTQTLLGKADVTNVIVNGISYASDNFVLNVTGTGKVGLINKTEIQDVELTKDEVLSLLQPYYIDGKTAYTVSVSDKDATTTVPITVNSIGGSSNTVTTSSYSFEAAFEGLDTVKKNQYNELGNTISHMYAKLMLGMPQGTELPNLLVRPDASLYQGVNQSGAILYMLDEKYGSTEKVLNDSFFSKIENKAELVIDDIIEFLEQYKDNKIFGGICSIISSGLNNLLGRGGFDEQSIKRKLEEDPVALAEIKSLIKKISVVRFFISEKRKIYSKTLEDDPDKKSQARSILKTTFDKVKFVGSQPSDASLYKTLKEHTMFNHLISQETTAGINMNRSARVLQKNIEKTLPNIDYSGERGNIHFDYDSSKLKSRGNATKIEIISDNMYRIQGLPIRFTDVSSLVRVANFTNYMLYTYGSNFAYKLKNNLYPHCLNWHNGYVPARDVFSPGIYENDYVGGFANVSVPLPDTKRILSKKDLYDRCPGWGDDEAKIFVIYLNDRFKLL